MRSLAEINQEYGQTCAHIGQAYAQGQGLKLQIAEHMKRLIQLETEADLRRSFEDEKKKESTQEAEEAVSPLEVSESVDP